MLILTHATKCAWFRRINEMLQFEGKRIKHAANLVRQKTLHEDPPEPNIDELMFSLWTPGKQIKSKQFRSKQREDERIKMHEVVRSQKSLVQVKRAKQELECIKLWIYKPLRRAQRFHEDLPKGKYTLKQTDQVFSYQGSSFSTGA